MCLCVSRDACQAPALLSDSVCLDGRVVVAAAWTVFACV